MHRWALYVFGSCALLIAQDLASAEQACILEDNACQCSVSKPTGKCIRQSSGGACVVGLCYSGYQCDCLGYELCTISSCGRYVATREGTVSDTEPFECKQVRDTRCINAVGFVDTIAAARNAEADAVMTAEAAGVLKSKAATSMKSLLDAKEIISQTLKTVENYSEGIQQAEMAEIRASAEQFSFSLEQANELASFLENEMEVLKRTLGDTRDMKQSAVTANFDAIEKQKELENEKKKLTKDDDRINRLVADVEHFVNKRETFAMSAGAKAREARDTLKSIANIEKQIQEARASATKAQSRLENKSRESIEKARRDGYEPPR